MNRSVQQKLVLAGTVSTILALGAIGGRQLYINRPGYGLPYVARFTPDVEDRWTALGGTWEISDGTMRNDSNDRGAKLLTGSAKWKDYIVEGDLQLFGKGSVGLLARVSEAEVGEDSFKGYFAGVRAVDNSLVLGAYDFAYHEAAIVHMPEPVRLFRWYHVRLQVNGCRITASAWAAGMREVKTAPVNDSDCFRTGVIGLRSNGSGGVWRNLTAVPVESAAAVSRPAQKDFSVEGTSLQRALLPGAGAPFVPVQPIVSLQYVAPLGSPVASVRGSVVLTRPTIYVQDSTAGVEIRPDSLMPLKIGDEVEVTGVVDLQGFSPVIRKARFRLLRESVPLSAMVITANQVAVGGYDGRFIQVEGLLNAISMEKDGSLKLDLDAGIHSFHALLPRGRSRDLFKRLALQSRLRLKGISVVDARFNKAADPFVVLMRSAEDLEVVAGPPWSRPSTLIFVGLVGLGLIFTLNHLYLLAKHWRLRAVAKERERLAHEIHDTLAQSFAGIGFQLQAIRNRVPGGAKALESQVDLAIAMARTSHEEARRSIATLRPESLGSTGLLRALRGFAEQMVKNGNVAVETYGEDGGRTVPPRVKDTLYRIGQEAIANSIRHACPGTIRITLQRTRSSICLSIGDDGQGFIVNSSHAGFGLLGMRRRAESISATLTVRSKPGEGTQVQVKAPVACTFWPTVAAS